MKGRTTNTQRKNAQVTGAGRVKGAGGLNG